MFQKMGSFAIAPWLVILPIFCCVSNAGDNRRISWWFDVAGNVTVDAANAAAIRAHRSVFSRVMPYNANIPLDGNVSYWWSDEQSVRGWVQPLQDLGVPVLPYLLDIDNATQMHLVYSNASKVVEDSVAIALHFGFQGWFIDYEDEYPPDTSPQKSQKLATFLTQLGGALQKQNMSLTICVAGWSKLLSDYTALANTPVSELQLMSTYSRPSNYQALISDYFSKVKAGAGDLRKAGVGLGIYYDGRNGYPNEWSEQSARSFMQYVTAQGGSSLDIFRLYQKEKYDWPHEEYWWRVLEEFINATTY